MSLGHVSLASALPPLCLGAGLCPSLLGSVQSSSCGQWGQKLQALGRAFAVRGREGGYSSTKSPRDKWGAPSQQLNHPHPGPLAASGESFKQRALCLHLPGHGRPCRGCLTGGGSQRLGARAAGLGLALEQPSTAAQSSLYVGLTTVVVALWYSGLLTSFPLALSRSFSKRRYSRRSRSSTETR